MKNTCIALGFVVAGSLYVATEAVAQSQALPKPTGACTITVYGITPTCTSAMTKNSCEASAKKVGGTAEWKEGKSC